MEAVTFTMTMCKRKDLMIKTMDSFLENCTDQHFITRWLAIDDGSKSSDLYDIASLYPFLEIHRNEYKGHASALNTLFNMVETPLIWHTEDDWLYSTPRDYITDCYDVMSQDMGDLKPTCVTLRVYHKHQQGCYSNNDPLVTAKGNEYRRRKKKSQWPGYTLNPSLQNLDAIKQSVSSDKVDAIGGLFNEGKRDFERGFAWRHRKANHETCQLLAPHDCTNNVGLRSHIEHLGHGQTAYKLNNTSR